MTKHLLTVIISVFYCYNAIAQFQVQFTVKDTLRNPIKSANISLSNNKDFNSITNEKGIAFFDLSSGTYNLKISHITYIPVYKSIQITKDTIFNIVLSEKKIELQEVVVTAKEKDAPTSTSVINKRAMQHLQPSSFSDLLSLLPGNRVHRPLLNQANHITLRETGIRSKDYDIGSLGTSFVVDDIPINSNANMQQTVGGEMLINPISGYADRKRNSVRKGVDMRSISTDNIEKVEVVRGIPSVKYGDLSSGLIKIIRKKGESDWSARFKADGFSKLFYVGKGFDFNNDFTLNFDIDYLNAKADPRNDFENYKRYTASVRTQKIFQTQNPLKWIFSFDYTGTIDEEKNDPDIEFNKGNSYKSDYKNIRIANNFNIEFNRLLVDNVDFSFSVSQSFDKLNQTKWVQISGASALPVNYDEGEHYGIFVEPTYVSNLLIDGKPLDIFVNLSGESKFNISSVKNTILWGGNWSYSKNNGLGQVYDLAHPPSPEMITRPRAFKDVPAMNILAFYLENNTEWKWKNTKFLFNLGVRSNSLAGLANSYTMHGKTYFDPRANFKIDLPKINFKNQKHLDLNLTFGWGKSTKMPTQSMLYPQDIYWDFIQFNYYHNNKDFRRVHFQTYIVPQTNYDLKPAVNLKREIRLGAKYDYHQFYVTYFSEVMTSGFRQMYDYKSISYKKYDASHINHSTITSAPLVENLPFETKKALILSDKESNGSAIYKKGIEFQYSGKRFKGINTRFTFNGAWFQTEYRNSLPVYKFPKKMILNGEKRYNLGLYDDEDSYFREEFNSALTADTYIPSLDLTTSFRVDFNWYFLNKQLPQNGTPTHYIDSNGEKHPYGENEKKDYVLQWLNINYNPSLFDSKRTPFSANAHIKISKKFYQYFTISMYVNKLFNVYSDYYVNGVKIKRRGLESPYFGMEMNINF
ncbi:TonB-dependent receptor plug domain-containing protein [Weeksellaceae bacterium TAE3-ERU29]|nr:TonB-dependent receptor plug domain-containing protein [Weeksellaceae bacterium TAE3-ERU29]